MSGLRRPGCFGGETLSALRPADGRVAQFFLLRMGSWATVEPADDYAIPTVLIFARLASQQ
jgi:hypothetical protein